jgi:DNA-binding NarL/FixJ family response regulator
MQATSDSSCTRVGLFSAESIRLIGLISAFENHPSIRIHIGELDELLSDSALHFLILDLSYNDAWMEIQSMVRRVRPDIRQIVLGPSGNEDLALRSIAAGARGYLDSSAGPLAVRQAVEAAMRGCIWASRRQLSKMIDQLLLQKNVDDPPAQPVYSPRERQVLDLIMTACSNREIATELGIEERTVKAYVSSLMRKTGVDNRVALSVQAMQKSQRNDTPVLS